MNQPPQAPASTTYLHGLGALLDLMQAGQASQIESAARSMAACIGDSGIVHLFGSGHSMLP
ncbi:MAG: SIS domain-containing protein, partial [Pseudomonadota bacterium]|nr:SIS domain-containing protein [Pseudomonadota bacterium]